MREPTVLLRREGEAPTSPGLVSAGTAAEGYRRLAVVSAVLAGAVLAILAVWVLEITSGEMDRSAGDLTSILSALLLTAAVAVGSHRRWFPERAFPAVALATEVAAAFLMSAGLLGWQLRLGPDAIAWLSEGGPKPLDLGAGELPMVGLWVMLFATVIPLPPRRHLVGALLSVMPLFLVPYLSVWWYAVPPEISAGAGTVAAATHVAVWLGFRGLLAAGMAYAAARTVHGLRRRLAHARRLGSYRLREKLGEGGMGEVWMADHHMLARPAAIKLIRPDPAGPGDADGTARFEREVQATAQLRSPHTVEIYDFGLTEDGTFYYAMELLDGLDLQSLVERFGPVPWPRAVHLLRQVCHSLGEAHDRGVVHRDIKPANIFLARIGRDADRVKVLDFGLVKARAEMAPDVGLTQEGAFVGTPAYASPELATRSESADPRSDLYALGCVAFWLLTGRRVFEASSPFDMLVKHATEPPPAPSTVSELEIPAALDRLVLDCLAKDPADRPPSADVLDERLRELEEGAGWTARDASEWWSTHRPTAGAPTSPRA